MPPPPSPETVREPASSTVPPTSAKSGRFPTVLPRLRPPVEPPPPNAAAIREFAASRSPLSLRRWTALRTVSLAYEDPSILQHFGRIFIGREGTEVEGVPEPHPVFDLLTLPSVHDLPSPPHLKAAVADFLARHPEWAEHPWLANGGEGLVFHSLKFRDPRVARARGKHGISTTEFGTGETIQMGFVMRLLQQLFPRAQCQSEAPICEPEDGQVIPLGIRDRAEMPTMPGESHEAEMRILKPANALGSALPRDALRAYLGIPPEAKVLALYPGCFWSGNGTSERKVVRGALEAYQPDVVLLLRRSSTTSNLEALGFREVKTLKTLIAAGLVGQDIDPLPLAGGDRPIALDIDVAGYAPYVHTIADLAVVQGAINWFEPLNAGCPTVLSYEFAGRDYDPAVRDMLAIMEGAGEVFAHASNVEEQSQAIRVLAGAERVPWAIRPCHRPGERGATRLDDAMLHLLEDVIGLELPHAKT